MNKIRLLIVLMVAVLVGGCLAYGTRSYMRGASAKTISAPTRPVVVATTNLALGSELRADDLSTIAWPASAVPEGAFAQPSEIIGRGLIMSVVRHEPILPLKLASKEAGSGLPPIIPEGKRAVSVKVNEVIGVAGYVLPGTFVDVLATANPTERPEDVTTKVVLTTVQVLTAGTRLEQDTKDGKPIQVTVVTLLVTPEEAERLTLATTEGKIQLALRNPLDSSAPNTPGVKPDALLGVTARPAAVKKAVKAPAPVPVPPPTIEIIRGEKRERAVVS